VTARAVPQWICVRACSACSGDYEDPERTAWSEAIDQDGDQQGEEERDEDASAENAEQSASREGFPAREK
jgi:hypothetical protein